MGVSLLPGRRRVVMSAPHRHRLPNRRPSHTETLEGAGQTFTAAVGFDPGTDRPCEVFLTACKEGSLMNASLGQERRSRAQGIHVCYG